MATCGQDCSQPNNRAYNLQLSTRQSLKRHWNHWHKSIGKDRLDEYLTDFDTQGTEHKCRTCSKRFSRSNILKDHQENVHGETGLLSISRLYCEVSFLLCKAAASTL